MNHFELFNLAVEFDIHLDKLADTYQTLQRLTHPDKFASGSEQDKLLAIQKNAQVNDAYSILKAPLARAEYMLQLRGIDLQHEQHTIKDTAFLMQQMEWREQLAEVEDQNEPLDVLSDLDDEIAALIKGELNHLEQLLAQQNDAANQNAANLVRKLKFLYKLRSEIELKEDALSDF